MDMMAAALYNRAAAPAVATPFAAPFAPRGVRARQDGLSSFSNSTITTQSSASASGSTSTSATIAPAADCSNFNGFKACSSSGGYGACLATAAPPACDCKEGLGYLDCVSAAIATSTCWGAVGVPAAGDWDAFKRGWFLTACPTPPSSAMAVLPQPTSVNIDLAPVQIVTPTVTPITSIQPVIQPTFSGAGQLLSQGDCASTSYTLVSAGDVVFYAALIGCMADRPQCCPWTVSTESVAATNDANRVAGAAGLFPVPASGVQLALSRCPDDYYSVSGQCCPNGYYKFTSKIAFQTPCFSSFRDQVTPPVLTAGLAANPTNTRLPTSAIVNVALAMGYNVTAEPTPPLSKGAAIGIGVGAGVLAIALIAMTVFVFMRVRRNKRRAAGANAGTAAAAAAVPSATPVMASTPHDAPYTDIPHPRGGGGMGAGAGGVGMAYKPGYNAPPGSPPMTSPMGSPTTLGTSTTPSHGGVGYPTSMTMPSPPPPPPPPHGEGVAGVGYARNPFSDHEEGSWGPGQQQENYHGYPPQWQQQQPQQGGGGVGGYPQAGYQQQGGYQQGGYQQGGYQQQQQQQQQQQPQEYRAELDDPRYRR